MRFRRSILPRCAMDGLFTLMLLAFTPITFAYELTIVLPAFHDTNGPIYTLLCVLASFLVFNLLGNMLMCMLVDTSIRAFSGEIMQPPKEHFRRKFWRFCHTCQSYAPPRSWHCDICRTCILKRDHHCVFTGCCIGHRNYRYFSLMLVYVAIGSAATTIYTSIYIWWLHAATFANLFTLFSMCVPIFMMVWDVSGNGFYLLIYELNIIALAYSVTLLIFHANIFLKGCVVHERHEQALRKYDQGWKRNLEMVLGRRMHWVWLSPFMKSPLPHNGINWETVSKQTPKSR